MKRNHSGFTLMEMLIVLVIIGAIATFVLGKTGPQTDAAMKQSTKIKMQQLIAKLDLYRLETGRYPNSQEGLQAMLTAPSGVSNWNGPYAKEDELKDAWNNKLKIVVPGKEGKAFELVSLGADGAEGGEGANADITLTN